MEIKKMLGKEELNDFTASNGWLESWKSTHGVKEKRLSGEADEIPTMTVDAWIEPLPELCHGYVFQGLAGERSSRKKQEAERWAEI